MPNLTRKSTAQITKELGAKRKARGTVADGTPAAKFLDLEIGEWEAELAERFEADLADYEGR